MNELSEDVSIPKRKPLVLYCWMLPLLWGAGCWTSYRFPGDEYVLWLLGSMAGTWIAVLKPDVGDIAGFLPVVFLTGTVVMLLVGVILDCLRVSFVAFLMIFILASASIVGLALQRFPSYQEALAKNGSLTAYLLFGALIGLYVAVILSAAGRILSLLIGRFRKRAP